MSILIAFLFSTLTASGLEDSRAGEMRPLSEVAEQAAMSYTPSRCAGLYLSLMEWTGSERMGEGTWEAMDRGREDFLLYAVLLSQDEQGGAWQDHARTISRQVRNIADLYTDRLDANYAVSGQAFANDTVIVPDLTYCRELAAVMSEHSPER